MLSNVASALAEGAGTSSAPSGPWEGGARVDAGPKSDRPISNVVLTTGRAGEVHAAWLEVRDAGSDCFVATSTDGGATWGEEMRVDPHPNQPRPWNSSCDVESDHQGHVWAAYSQRVINGWRVVFARWDEVDGATSFRTPVQVNPGGDDTQVQEYPMLARSAQGILYIVFVQRTSSTSRLLVTVSEDGLNAQLPRQVETNAPDNTGDVSGDVCVAPNGTVVIAYGFKAPGVAGIKVARKAPAASTYTVSTVYTIDETPPRELAPRVAVGPTGTVGMVFSPGGGGGVLHMRSTDGGATWSEPVTVFTDPDANATQADPSVAFDPLGQMHVVLTRAVAGTPSRVLHSYTSDGSVFTTPLEVGAAWDVAKNGTRGKEGPAAIQPIANGTLLAVYGALRNQTVGVYASSWPNLPPRTTIVAPSKGATVRGTLSTQGTARDPGGVSGLAYVYVKMGTLGPFRLKGATSWNYDFDTTKLPDGQAEISVWASDGFLEGPTTSINVTVDNNQPPELTVDFPRDGAKYRGTVPVAGTVRDPEGLREDWKLQWKLQDTNWTDLTEPAVPDPHIANFSTQLDLSMRPNGQSLLSVRASDGEKWSQVMTRTIYMENRPDLYINASRIEWVPAQPKQGDKVVVTVFIENIGATLAPKFELTFHIGPKLLDDAEGANLPPGKDESLVFYWNATAGNFTFTFTADPRALIDEADETNDRATFNIGVAKVVEEKAFPVWIVVVVVLLVVVALVALVLVRRGRAGKEVAPPPAYGTEGRVGEVQYASDDQGAGGDDGHGEDAGGGVA